ncbi:MAG: TolC family protein [Cyclobacteriaceae bacterium]
MKIFALTFLFAYSFASCAQAQDADIRALTLEECIQIALNKNLTIKGAENSLLAARSNRNQAKFNFLPNLNANLNYSTNDGSGINNAGEVVTNASDQSRPRLSSNLVLFNAFANHHLLSRRRHEYESFRYQLENQKIVTQATVVRNYLNVLVDEENVRISDQRLQFLEEQLDRERKRESVGVGNLETVYNFQSQVATERLTNVNLKNQYQSDLLTLLQSLQLNDGSDIRVVPLETADLDGLLEYEEYPIVLKEIMQNSFSLKSANESQIAAQSQLKQARSARYPTLSLFAQHSRNYSSAADPSFNDQIENNRTDFIQGTLAIPIFNQYQAQNAIDNSRVGFLNAQLQNDQATLDVTNAAQRDYLDLVSAQTSYRTAAENFEALNQTFEFIKKRFEAGNTDFYSYLESLNNKNRAEAQLVNAKYTIVLRTRILDLYRGI